MNSGKYLFSQLVEFLPKRIFDGIVKKYGGDRCYAIKNKSYHLGFGSGDIRLSNVAYANANRDYRQKSHLNYEIVDGEDLLDQTDNVLLDQTIRLTGYQTKKKYPDNLRRIVYYAPELKRTFTFLTNRSALPLGSSKNFVLKASDIALLYKQRWQGELFFRWIKQHLRITSFGGNTENAVRIQIYVAV